MNVYMQPLKDELQEAWDNGVMTYDAARKENFKMHVWYASLVGVCDNMWMVCAWNVTMLHIQGSSSVSLVAGGSEAFLIVLA